MAVPSTCTFCRLVLARCISMRLLLAIEERVMLERRKIEIGAKLAVDARQEIEIEFCGHAFGVVIGAIEHRRSP